MGGGGQGAGGWGEGNGGRTLHFYVQCQPGGEIEALVKPFTLFFLFITFCIYLFFLFYYFFRRGGGGLEVACLLMFANF